MRHTATPCLVILTLTGLLAAFAGNGRVEAQSRQTDTAAVQTVLDDYIALYQKDTLDRWKALFLPGFTASYTNDDGGVTTRPLEDFFARQRGAFERGPVSERLENVRITRVGRLAQAFADFHFTSGGATRHGQLMLALIEDRGRFQIAALTFTYHLQ